MNTISAYRLKYFKIIGLRDGFLCGLKMKKILLLKESNTTFIERQLKISPLLLMVILFYNFIAGQKILLSPSNASGEASLEKNLQLSKKPARKVGSLGFALGFELFEVYL